METSELVDEVKENTFEYCANDIIAQAKQEAPERGFLIDKIYYTGFWSQGDGASWVGNVSVPDYIEYKIRNGGVEGIPHGVMEVMYWLFKGGVFDWKLSVSHHGHYSHDGCMQLADFYWTFAGSNDTETMGTYGGPFEHTPIKELLKVTNWSWENESDAGDYYNLLYAKIYDDARDYAKSIYRKLEEAYSSVYAEVEG